MIDQPPAIIIEHDAGGRVGEYLRRVHDAKAIHVLVKINGDCFSACTLYLGLPRDQVCITSNARLGFHHASPAQFDGVLLANYPLVITHWIEHDGGLTYDLKYLGYPELKTLYKTCP